MSISNDLIKQFVQITKDNSPVKHEATVYGTAVEYEGKTYVQIDGSELLTPVETSTEIANGERVTVMIKDHNATVTGNLTNPSAGSNTVANIQGDLNNIGTQITQFEVVIADKVSTKDFEANNAAINNLLVGKADIAELNAVKGNIETLQSEHATINELIAEKADITDLNATNAKIETLKTSKADIEDLNATTANVNDLTADIAKISTLIGGDASIDNVQTILLTSSNTSIDNALIKNAMIDTISADKINTGTLNTNKVNIQSEDGGIVLSGSTQQFKDQNGKVRVQIGKDAQGNFTFCLFSQDGTGILLDETGIKAGAVPDGLIVNDMVADNANISGSKLDISSVITEINGNSSTIKSSVIKFDDTGQSLTVAFNTLKDKVNSIEEITIDGDLSSVMEQVRTNTTKIEAIQGSIETLVSNTTITKEDGQVIQLKDDYSTTKQTVNEISTKIGTLETNYKKTLKTSSVQYYLSTSLTSLSGGSWQDTAPTWTQGKYMWQRMKYTYTDGSTTYGTASCVAGAKGDTGEQGPQGPQGEQGVQGPQGEQGIQGVKGDTGAQGPQGEKGDKGDKGDTGPQGVQGPAGNDGKTYYTWIKYADSSTGSGMSNDPTGKTHIGFAYNKATPTESNTASDYTWSLIKGDKGDTGVQGPAGQNGVTTYTWIKYSDNADGTGLYDTPKSTTKYIGIATNKTTATESTTKTDYTWSLFKGDTGAQGPQGEQGIQGPQGLKGDTGISISKITNYYLATNLSSGVTSATTGWTTTIQNVSSTKKYLWNYEKVEYSSGNPTVTTPCIIGAYGDTGPQGGKGDTGATGKGISLITEYYQVSNSNTTAPTSWSTTVPKLTTTNRYLWNYENIKYTDNSSVDTTKKVIGVYGDTGAQGPQGDKGATGEKGQSLTSSTPQWYLSTSNTTQTGGSWQDTMPQVTSGKYIWQRFKNVWANPTATTYTTPVLEQIAESVKEVTSKQAEYKQTLDEVSSTLTSTTATANAAKTQASTNKQTIDSISTTLTSTTTTANEAKTQASTNKQTIDSMSTTLTETTTTANNALNKATTAQQNLDGFKTTVSNTYATKNALSEVKQTADSITSTVTKDYATKSLVTQTANGINYSFSHSGVPNLLYNGNFVSGFDCWGVYSEGGWSRINNLERTYIVACSPGIGKTNYLIQFVPINRYIGHITCSCKMYVSSEGSDGTTNPFRNLYLQIRKADGNTIYLEKGVTNFDTWETVSITCYVNACVTEIEVFCYTRDTAKTTHFAEVMLTEGDVVHEFSQAKCEMNYNSTTINTNGITVYFDGDRGQGSSNLNYDGLTIYDSNGNKKAWFGNANSAYIDQISTNRLNEPSVLKCASLRGAPGTIYITTSATGDGSGRDTNNFANSITSALNYFRETYGNYHYAQDLRVYVCNGEYWQDAFISGWLGSGKLEIYLEPNVIWHGKFTVEECHKVVHIRTDREWASNSGAIIYHDNPFYIRASNVQISGFRASSSSEHTGTFLQAFNSASVVAENCDIVNYHNVLGGWFSCFHMGDIRGAVTSLAWDFLSNDLIWLASCPVIKSKAFNSTWNSRVNADSPQINSVWQPWSSGYVPPAQPTENWVQVEQTFWATDLHTVPEGSGSGTTARSGCWGQGNWSSYKAHRGWAGFEGVSSWCSGGRNFWAQITMHRLATKHGNYGAIPVPKFVQSDGSSWSCGQAFALDTTYTITLPWGVTSRLINGESNYLQLWAGKSTNDYSFYDNVSLRVVCEKNMV